MGRPKLSSRREFNRILAAGLFSGISSNSIASRGAQKILAAAIQMTPVLGDVTKNMNQAERLVRKAVGQGARWIILPEMFTSGVAFHPNMLQAIRPLEGEPLHMLRTLAREGNATIGGSFLARRGDEVFNTFVLVAPDGSYTRHDKDLPTYWENCYYRKGADDGVLNTSLGPVGAVLCWEFIRSATARRLFNKVNFVVGGSCWWTLPDDADPAHPRRAANLKMLRDAPVRMAQMLGVPVIHGSNAGGFEGYFSPELPDVAYNSSYLGEASIIDAQGRVLARREGRAGEGVITAEITIDQPSPTSPIPQEFWTPKEMPQEWKDSFNRWLVKGPDYFALVTQIYLQTGVVPEYTPEYLR